MGGTTPSGVDISISSTGVSGGTDGGARTYSSRGEPMDRSLIQSCPRTTLLQFVLSEHRARGDNRRHGAMMIKVLHCDSPSLNLAQASEEFYRCNSK